MSGSALKKSEGGNITASKPRATPADTIEAHSRARVSYARIWVLGGALLLLCISLWVAMCTNSDIAENILIVISGVCGYVAGGQEMTKGQR